MKPLDGLRIVVTRPQGQAAALAELIRAAGGEPVLFPTIDIAPLGDHAGLDAALDVLAQNDLVVFVSANAVEQTFARLGARGQAWPSRTRVAATGPATAAQLLVHGAARGVRDVIHPPLRFDSEGLLAELDRLGVLDVPGRLPTPRPAPLPLPALAAAPPARRVLIVRGTGGREWLLDALQVRGVQVQAVASYVRLRGSASASALLQEGARGRIAAITVTSSEGGENLIAMLAQDASKGQAAAALRAVPLFVPHPRIAARMRALDCTRVIETAGGDAGLMAGLGAHFSETARVA